MSICIPPESVLSKRLSSSPSNVIGASGRAQTSIVLSWDSLTHAVSGFRGYSVVLVHTRRGAARGDAASPWYDSLLFEVFLQRMIDDDDDNSINCLRQALAASALGVTRRFATKKIEIGPDCRHCYRTRQIRSSDAAAAAAAAMRSERSEQQERKGRNESVTSARPITDTSTFTNESRLVFIVHTHGPLCICTVSSSSSCRRRCCCHSSLA